MRKYQAQHWFSFPHANSFIFQFPIAVSTHNMWLNNEEKKSRVQANIDFLQFVLV